MRASRPASAWRRDRNLNQAYPSRRTVPRSGTTSHYWIEFVESFQKKLESRLTTQVRTYRDPILKSQPGLAYPLELAQALCKSVCMVAILVPDYLESSWCLAEWRAMEQLEAKRLGAGKMGLIIPVVFRGDTQRIKSLSGDRQHVDMRGVQKPSTDLNTKANLKEIEHIAEKLVHWTNILGASCGDCNEFKISIIENQHLDITDDPNPFAA